MGRASDKHGPRLDERRTDGELGSSHVEERRRQEEDVPTMGGYPPGHAPGTPEGITAEGVGQRSELARWLSGVDYAADRDRLMAHARRMSAPDFVLEAVGRLPRGTRFANVAEVAEALGLGIERKRW
ncbi:MULTISPECIES: DUF2795 domain-containing protein [Nonomuraea]|uniref:DUF2795 domain-containing protein n=1 Tax=Nonomuraea mangrovi TaxID=2316207 RepID=A0ABW4SSE1_9ACTN